MMTEKDFKALVKSREILESVQHRTPFGRSLTIHNGKWDDTDKAVIGYYEAGTVIDPSNPIAVDKYITESAYFLNNLNEHLHMDGYHFDMTGTTNGAVYFAKDRNWYGEGMTTSEDEASIYIQETAYRMYLLNKDRCQQQVRHMIDEAMILTDDQLAITEKVDSLMILNEGIGDKLSGAWDKFVAFINKIFNKFIEFITRTVNSDKAYLEKYKDIILHRKYQADEVDADGNYETGVHRLSTFQIAIPDTARVQQWPVDENGNNDANLKAVQQQVFPEFQGKEEFREFTKNWFKGGEDGKTYPLNDTTINFSNIYNFCYNFEKIRKNLNKNRTLLTNAITNFKNAAKETFDEKRKTTPAGTAAAPAQKNATTYNIQEYNGKKYIVSGTQAVLVSAQDVQTIGNDQAKMATAFNTGTKVDVSALGKTNTGKATIAVTKEPTAQENGTVTVTPPGGQAIIVTIDKSKLAGFNAIKANLGNNLIPLLSDADKTKLNGIQLESTTLRGVYKILNEALTKSGSSGGSGGSAPGNFANMTSGGAMRERQGQGREVDTSKVATTGDLDKLEKKFSTQVGYFNSAAGDIFASMLTAAETIKKDYMKLISIHVKSYIGEKESERSENKQAAKGMTDYSGEVATGFSDEKVKAHTGLSQNNIADLVKELKTLQQNQQQDPNDAANNKAIYDILHQVSLLNSNRGVPNKVYTTLDAAISDLEAAQPQQQATT